MIYYFPLEKIDRRYTNEMRDHNYKVLRSVSDVVVIDGITKARSPDPSQFLSPADTIAFKSSQIMQAAMHFQAAKIKENTLFFFDDIWMPGIEGIKYIAGMLGIKIKMAGFLHAGSHTPSDDVAQKLDKEWTRPYELSLLNMMDAILVGSRFHKHEILRCHLIDRVKVVVNAIPCGLEKLEDRAVSEWRRRDNVVVFPCRLHPEKQPELFDKVAEWVRIRRPDISFMKTHEMNLSKEEYFTLLSNSKLAISFALQENYGIAMQEALALGCNVMVPDRLAYPEFFPSCCRYKTEVENDIPWMGELVINSIDRRQPIDVASHFEQWRRDQDALTITLMDLV